jgi:hypothetical protein
MPQLWCDERVLVARSSVWKGEGDAVAVRWWWTSPLVGGWRPRVTRAGRLRAPREWTPGAWGHQSLEEGRLQVLD